MPKWRYLAAPCTSSRSARHGKSAILSSPVCKNILIFNIPNQVYIIAVPPTEGRIAIVTDAGRDAVDAEARLTNVPTRTAKSCGPDTPTLVSSRRSYLAWRRWQ